MVDFNLQANMVRLLGSFNGYQCQYPRGKNDYYHMVFDTDKKEMDLAHCDKTKVDNKDRAGLP